MSSAADRDSGGCCACFMGTAATGAQENKDGIKSDFINITNSMADAPRAGTAAVPPMQHAQPGKSRLTGMEFLRDITGLHNERERRSLIGDATQPFEGNFGEVSCLTEAEREDLIGRGALALGASKRDVTWGSPCRSSEDIRAYDVPNLKMQTFGLATRTEYGQVAMPKDLGLVTHKAATTQVAELDSEICKQTEEDDLDSADFGCEERSEQADAVLGAPHQCVGCNREPKMLFMCGRGPMCEECNAKDIESQQPRCKICSTAITGKYKKAKDGTPKCLDCYEKTKKMCVTCRLTIVGKFFHTDHGAVCDKCHEESPRCVHCHLHVVGEHYPDFQGKGPLCLECKAEFDPAKKCQRCHVLIQGLGARFVTSDGNLCPDCAQARPSESSDSNAAPGVNPLPPISDPSRETPRLASPSHAGAGSLSGAGAGAGAEGGGAGEGGAFFAKQSPPVPGVPEEPTPSREQLVRAFRDQVRGLRSNLEEQKGLNQSKLAMMNDML